LHLIDLYFRQVEVRPCLVQFHLLAEYPAALDPLFLELEVRLLLLAMLLAQTAVVFLVYFLDRTSVG
jgi:hypothetical protein